MTKRHEVPDYEPHDSAARHSQPWGKQEVAQYSPEHEVLWTDYVTARELGKLTEELGAILSVLHPKDVNYDRLDEIIQYAIEKSDQLPAGSPALGEYVAIADIAKSVKNRHLSFLAQMGEVVVNG